MRRSKNIIFRFYWSRTSSVPWICHSQHVPSSSSWETLGNRCEWKGWVGEEFGEGIPSHKCLGLDVTHLFTFLRQGLHRSSHLNRYQSIWEIWFSCVLRERKQGGEHLAYLCQKFDVGILVVCSRIVQGTKCGSKLTLKIYFNFHHSLNSLKL